MISNKLWVALPVYNEWPAAKDLIDDLFSTLETDFENFELVICDDGSTDEGKEYFNSLKFIDKVHIIQHKYNRGLGESIRDLFEYIIEESDEGDYLIRMDGDATHNPIYLKKLVNSLSNEYDISIAYRETLNNKDLKLIRKFYSFFAKYFIRLFFPVPKLNEYTGGFRCYKVDILKKALIIYGSHFIQLSSFGFVCTFEKLIKLSLIGAKFVEVPFVLEYERKTSESKMVPWITILGYFILIPAVYWPKTGWKYKHKVK